MVILVLVLFRKSFNLIISFIQEAVDNYIPSQSSRSVASVPWITYKIRRKIRKRNKTHAKAIKTGSRKLRSKFQELIQEVKADIKKQHDLYINNLVGDIKVNPKDFYRYANREKTFRVSLLSKGEMVVVWLSLQLSWLRSSMVSLQIYRQTSESEVPLLDKSARPMSDIHISNESDIKR